MFYIWDDLLLFKIRVDMTIRRCVPESEHGRILQEYHASCNTPKYTLVVFNVFRVLCRHKLIFFVIEMRKHGKLETRKNVQDIRTKV